MKTAFALMMLIGVQSLAQPNLIRSPNVNIVNVNVAQPLVAATVAYPSSPVSGVCALEIVADLDGQGLAISNLQRVVDVIDAHKRPVAVQVISSTTLRITLPASYVEIVTVKTKNGRPLSEAIAQVLGKNRTVLILPRTCN